MARAPPFLLVLVLLPVLLVVLLARACRRGGHIRRPQVLLGSSGRPRPLRRERHLRGPPRPVLRQLSASSPSSDDELCSSATSSKKRLSTSTRIPVPGKPSFPS
uniref:OO_Ba0013J05-OO_Ba0033A15.13 protein n=1 Tax=Oryza officinalis TaxID=4535 RepID=D0ABF6_9ORYZ|nr:OO_Ba0013J05-OO_Ba0033A15.13 [Oryza officinalis]